MTRLVAMESILVRGAPVAPGEEFEADEATAAILKGMRRARVAPPAFAAEGGAVGEKEGGGEEEGGTGAARTAGRKRSRRAGPSGAE